MYAISLGDGAELGPLEPWQAEEFLAHVDRGREFIGRYIGLADAVTDLGSSRAYLHSYAEKAATDTGRASTADRRTRSLACGLAAYAVPG